MKTTVALFCLVASCFGRAGTTSPFGVCSHITRDEDVEQVFARCVEAGIRNVRSDFDWWRFQNKPEEWKSSRFAEILAKARTAGVTVLPIATGGCNFSSPTSGTPESFRQFGAFVGRLVGEFKDELPVVEIWNEQNIGGFWPPKPNVAHYVGTLREAYKAAKAANPSVRVAFGGTAGPDVGFYQQAYANGAKDCFDIVNIHPYCMPNAPEGWLERQLGLIRETMARNGDAAKPIWITEMGWATREIEWPKSEQGMVRGAFRALGLDGRKNLRVLVIEQSHPGPTDRWFSDVWRQELPEGAELVNCTYGDVLDRLAEGPWDAVVMPFDESCPLHATEALVDHVRRGGALIDFGGVPGYFSFTREKDGTIVNGPNGNEAFRKALRIEARHQGCDASVAANGFDTGPDGVKNYPGWRSFGAKYLRPGDTMMPMMVGPGNVAVAALYEFNSDFKGKIFAAGRALAFVGSATSERTQAAMTVRAALTALRLGVEKYFVYEFQAPETSRTNPESHFGLLHKDYTPKPAFQAYKTLIGLWPEGSLIVKDEPWRSEGLYRVTWRQPNGTCVTALWTDGPERTVPAAQVKGTKVVDLYGRPVGATEEDLSVGTDPVFVIASVSPEELVACPVSANLRGHENVEWSISYAFHLTDRNRDLPRVLLVGDSICNGYQDEVQKRLEGKMNVSYWVSSYCVTSPGYLKLLDFYLSEARYDVVHFNNGCHSFDTDDADWEKGLRGALQLIRQRQPQARIVWAATTPNRDDKKNLRVQALNAVASKVIAEFDGIRANDLYALMDPLDRNTQWRDDYHFASSAIATQAEAVARACQATAGNRWVQ